MSITERIERVARELEQLVDEEEVSMFEVLSASHAIEHLHEALESYRRAIHIINHRITSVDTSRVLHHHHEEHEIRTHV